MGQEYRRLPFPHDRITYTRFKTPPVVVSKTEYSRQNPCSFKGFGDPKSQSARCEMEIIEHQLVSEFIPSHANVLELGARFGTTSCAISRKVFEKGVVVSVEPDERVWRHLDQNRKSHHCSFFIVHAPIGNSTVSVGKGNYETIASYSNMPQKRDESGRPNFYTFSELEAALDVRFDALLIDCEGCIDFLFEDNGRSLRQVLSNINLIIIEADNPTGPSSPCTLACVDYGVWLQKLGSAGFRVVRKLQDTKFKWIMHCVLLR